MYRKTNSGGPADGVATRTVKGPNRPQPEAERMFEEHIPLVRALIGDTLRRHRVDACDRDDFESLVWIKLLRDDYRVLREFRSAAALPTYLRTVLDRLMLDSRTARWGRWRPSAKARRGGGVALEFERLVEREGYTTEAAFEQLSQVHGRAATAAAAAGLRAARVRRRVVSDAHLEGVACPGPAPDAEIDRRGRARTAEHVADVLREAICGLSDRDRDLLRDKFSHQMSVVDTARRLNTPPQPLYRRLQAIQRHVRAGLERHGVGGQDIRAVTGGPESLIPEIL